MRNIIKLILEEDEMNKFSNWAFGNDVNEINEKDIKDVWNERHGKILQFKQQELQAYDITEMILLWKIVA